MADMLQLLGDVNKQRATTIDTIRQSQGRITNSDVMFQQSINNLSRQQQVVFKDAQETLQNLRTIGRMPKGIPELLGIFNEDFAPRSQEAKLQSDELELQRLGLQMQQVSQVHKMNVEQAVREQGAAVEILQFTREGILDSQRMAEFGLAVREHELRIDAHTRNVLERNLEDQSLDTLISWQTDPSKAPRELQDKPGLIRGMILQKSDIETQAHMRAMALETSQKDQLLRSLPTEQMQPILAGRAPIPEGLSLGEIEDSYINKNRVKLLNEATQLANQTGNIQLREALKAELVLNKSASEIQEMLNSIDPTQNTGTFNGIEFSRNALTIAFSQKLNEERERNNAIADRVIQMTGVKGAMIENDTIAQSLQLVTNPHTMFNPEDPYSLLPPAVKVQAMTNEAKINQASALGNADLIIKYNQEQREFLRSARDAYIENQPKELKEPTREFMENRKFITPKNANSYMLNNAGNPGLLGPDPVLGPVWSAFSNSFIEQAKQQTSGISFDPTTGSVDLTGKGLDPAVFTEEAIRKGNVRSVAQSHLYQESIRIALTNLARGSPETWSKYVNQNSGNLSNLFYELREVEDDEGNTIQQLAFSPNQMLAALSADSVVLQQRGVLQPNDTLIDTLIGEIRNSSVPAIRQIGSNSIAGSALMFSLYGEVPEQAIMTEINALEVSAKTAIHEATIAGQKLQIIRDTQAQFRDPSMTNQSPIEEQIRRAIGGAQ